MRKLRSAQRASVAPRENYAARVARNALALPARENYPARVARNAPALLARAKYAARVTRNATAGILGGREVFWEGERCFGREGGVLGGR
ncbi:MAG: hypothetical protein GY820_36700, partial [Gammaproteobacteria bacterium]|nr:hypothetical protein [Gammaproteobacteria bacterium]